MEIKFGDQIITSNYFTEFETAWRIEDAICVFGYLKSRNKIILGGDILTENMDYTYDSWYYNPILTQSQQSNVELGYEQAIEYISKYMKRNGSAFYVVIVAENDELK